jgi:hypothetical protein
MKDALSVLLVLGIIVGALAINVLVFRECMQTHSLLYCTFR